MLRYLSAFAGFPSSLQSVRQLYYLSDFWQEQSSCILRLPAVFRLFWLFHLSTAAWWRYPDWLLFQRDFHVSAVRWLHGRECGKWTVYRQNTVRNKFHRFLIPHWWLPVWDIHILVLLMKCAVFLLYYHLLNLILYVVYYLKKCIVNRYLK